MTVPHPIETERLLLRQWISADREPFARLNNDAEVMRYFPARLSRAESDTMAERLEGQAEKQSRREESDMTGSTQKWNPADYTENARLCDAAGNWHADYVRLRFSAIKPASDGA